MVAIPTISTANLPLIAGQTDKVGEASNDCLGRLETVHHQRPVKLEVSSLWTGVNVGQDVQLRPEVDQFTWITRPLQGYHQLLHRLSETLRGLKLVNDGLHVGLVTSVWNIISQMQPSDWSQQGLLLVKLSNRGFIK